MSKDDVKAFKAPSPIIILVCVIVLCALASYVIPAGVYDRVKDVHTGKMVVNPPCDRRRCDPRWRGF